MPKNKGRGGKNYKRGKHNGPIKRDLLMKDADEGLQYGLALKMLGNGRVRVRCFDQVQRIGNIRGKMKRKVWIGVGDLLMCSLRDFQNDKCDIIMKYTPDQIRQLKANQQVPQDLQINEAEAQMGATGIEFADNNQKGEGDDDSDEDSEEDSDEMQEGDFMNMKNKKIQNIDIDNL